ncbi:MAG: hypothetical protein IKY41_06175 [Clostridia bacterium]|nr:hypothetical protein [Clostridia bacterium]
MKATKAKQHFEAIKSYISAMHMRVDDENVVKARSLIAYLNERIIECNEEIAKEAQKEAEETNKETEA